MKQITLFILFFSTIYSTVGQDLINRVPKTAECVISLDGQKLTEKIGLKTLKESAAYLRFLNDIAFSHPQNNRMSDLGINLEKGFVCFFNASEKMEYMGYLYAIENPGLFAKYIQETAGNNEIIDREAFKVVFYENNYQMIAWNEKYAFYVQIDYLDESIEPLTNYNSWYDYYPYEEVEEVEEMEEVEEPVYETIESEGSCEEGACEEGACDRGDNVEVTYSDRPERDYEAEEQLRKQRQAENKRLREERIALLHEAYIEMLNPYFDSNPSSSILDLTEYTSGKNNDGDIYIWLNTDRLHSSPRFFGYYGYGGRRYFRRLLYGMNRYFGESMTANVIFETDQIQLTSSIKHRPEIVGYLNEIYSTKFPKKLLKHVNIENVLFASSMSLSAEKVWQYYPKILIDHYERYIDENDDYREEISVFKDFLEVLMDEEALGDLMTGNALFILKDIVQKEVKYKSYEYTDYYSERVEVERTGIELFPQFMGLFTTENEEFLNRVMRLFVKREVMYTRENYYYTSRDNGEFPFEMGFAIRKGVVMLSTDLNEIEQFANGKSQSNVPSEIKNQILENQGYGYINLQEFLGHLPVDRMNEREKATLNYAKEHSRTIQLITNMENDLFETTVSVAIPKEAENGAAYLWGFIEQLYIINEE